ncbi:hypothetical protein [Mesorhizobium sp. Root157]|uniref:hypothetical protein n=1 Tax=Mesorhizobium sp. Root157 TaxID=1736477 RepID=UPI0012E3E325|nr:hypothetical protein [Mesorhizobium sp. Root157]
MLKIPHYEWLRSDALSWNCALARKQSDCGEVERDAKTVATLVGRRLMELLLFERDDVLEAIDDTAANLQVARALFKPAPALKGAWAKLPAARKLDLIEMTKIVHNVLHQKYLPIPRSLLSLWGTAFSFDGMRFGLYGRRRQFL